MIAELSSLDIEYSFVCDDVRREDNGKLMFIGVYANNILLKAFPVALRLQLVTRLRPKAVDFPLAFRMTIGGETQLFMKANLSSSDLSPETSHSPPFQIQFNNPGMLEIDVVDAEFDPETADSLPWKPLFKIPIELAPSD